MTCINCDIFILGILGYEAQLINACSLIERVQATPPHPPSLIMIM